MTAREASCPACGATISFRWAQAVQTTCPYCQSVLVRKDLDLALLGQQALLPLTPSPIQLGTTGTWDGKRFEVIGRLVYRYGRGGWNEWHCLLAGNRSAWLGDAQLDYTMTTQSELPLDVADDRLRPGALVTLGRDEYEVRSRTVASYAGSEGELPFEYFGVRDVPFIDLVRPDGRFATIDRSETPALLFTGRYVTPAELDLKNLRTFEGW